MVNRDVEVDAMASILELLAPLDPEAKTRVAAWVYDRFANSHGAGWAAGKDGSMDIVARHAKVTDFIEFKGPRTKLERLLCLLFWAEAQGADGGVPIRVLNDLNRDVPGERFSDAASIAQGAITEKEYIARVSPGHVALTSRGRRVVETMAHPTK